MIITKIMKSNTKKLCSVIIIFLSTSTSFVSAFNTAFVVTATAESSGTCTSVVEREVDWPIVQYCAEPAVVGTDNQFYVYVDKHSEEPEFAQIVLEPKGINIQQVEPLTPDTISFVDGKIIVRDTGQFIIHGNPAVCSGIYNEGACNKASCEWHDAYCGDVNCLYEKKDECEGATDCSWDYYKNHCCNIHTECSEIELSGMCTSHPDCAWQVEHCTESEYQLKLSSTNKKVQLFPAEECVNLTSFMLYAQESGRERYVDIKSPLGSFTAFLAAGIITVLSQVQPTTPTAPETLPVLKEGMETMPSTVLGVVKTDLAAAISGEKRSSVIDFNDEGVANSVASYVTENFPEVYLERYQRESLTPNKMAYFLFISRDESVAKEIKAEYMKGIELMDHEKIGILLGFPEADAKFFAETYGVPGAPRGVDIAYEGFRSGIEFSPELFFADYIYRSVGATDSLQYVRSRLFIKHAIFSHDYLLNKFNEERNALISNIRWNYDDELTYQDIQALENYFPKEEDFLVRLELLTGSKIKIERYAKANEIGKELLEMRKTINDAWDKKDLDGLKTEIENRQILLERILELPDSDYKTSLLNAYGENFRLAGRYKTTLTYDKYEVWDLEDPILESTRVTDSEIKNANSLVKKNVFESQLIVAERSGEISISLPEKYIPTSEAAQVLDEAGLEYIGIGSTVGGTLEELSLLRAAETLDRASDSVLEGVVPEEYKRPSDIAQLKYGGYITGAGLTALFTLGPRLENLGRKTGDVTLLVAADVIKVGGFAAMATTFFSAWATTESFKMAIMQTLVLIADPINVLGLESGLVVPDISGFVIYIIAHFVVNYLWCNLVDPESTACGCSPNPAYGKAQLELEKNIVNPGEKINFVVYGMQHCGPKGSKDDKLYTLSLLKDVETKGDPMKFLANCLFEEEYKGTCCEGEYTVDLDGGDYEIYGEVQSISFGGGWKPYTDPKTLTVLGSLSELTSISLEPGWNLVSTPYKTVTFDTGDCTLFSKALNYSAGRYDEINIKGIDGGIGYWVYSYSDCKIGLSDKSNPISAPTEFTGGWNQIAIPLGGLHKDNVMCDQIEDPKIWNTETNDWVYVENMYPGKSYFVDCYPAH